MPLCAYVSGFLTTRFEGSRNDMRKTRVWARLLGLGAAVVEDVYCGDQGEVVVAARPRSSGRDRCGVCGQRCPGFDLGEGRRRWRALDLGATLAFVEAEAPRVRCAEHGVVVCAVPWARHQSRFTRSFEDQVAWLAVRCSKSAVAELMRVAWRTVGRIIERVVADTGRRVWAARGRDRKTVLAFLDQLGQERAQSIRLVSADMASWISGPVAERCPNAVLCIDAFHVVQGATDALDQVRREVWNEARKAGQDQLAHRLKGARYALWKNPENLTGRQRGKLSEIQRTNRRLYRAYLLKEQLRQIYRLPAEAAIALLDRWISWARRCRLPSFVKLAKTITAQRPGIIAAIEHDLSNARVEAANTTIRLIARRAFGFHTATALIALAKLTLSGLCPPLPGRVT